MYLNTDIYEYLYMREEARESAFREVFQNVLTSIGQNRGEFVRARFLPEHENGHPLGRTEVSRFRDGRAWYFGVLPNYAVEDKSPRHASLPFRAGAHIYDVRAHQYLGNGGRVPVVLQPGRPELYAALPYEITGVRAQGRKEARLGEKVDVLVQVSVNSGAAGFHAARVRVVGPDGAEAEYYTRTIRLPDGNGVLSFIPSLNEPKGRWKVEVTECVSGKQAYHSIGVR